ncbi:hypothetical protein [Actinacidiphila bryophytorum]|uniref:Lipoprotein n=1 Tax=Actinacidiphila bryophytorum TaxID=1436133 RepID=A0A9W4H1I2_9ACTN|nr:hypothetical protein [Actinacidiphila bryophytorum]MBM9435084.1 hypothetical protein [Actinacidiphila bryophytorum]MBN6543088.1 hypothetical protein [Actinacidiphila bryophytorum]CAG7643013.1 conserved exported hypothetical protein [Actinacidiphila bryophytorum]
MDTRRLRIGTAAAAALLAGAAACGHDSGGTARQGAPTPPPTTSAPTTARPAPTTPPATEPAAPATTPPVPTRTATTAPPARSDTAACFDGTCEISVAEPLTIRVDSHRFGFSSFRITEVGAGGVTVEARTGGTYLQSGVSPGGTAGLNDLQVRVKSVRGGVADLVLSVR